MNRPARPAAPPPPRPTEQARSDENFPVALRVLPAVTRRHLHAVYDYARYVDDLGDEPVADSSSLDRLAALDAFETELRDLYAGRPVHHSVLRTLAPTARDCKLPLDPLVRLIEANRVDQHVTRYGTFDQLVDYCKLSANPVGELVLHVFGQASTERVALSDRVCTALQLIEHLQDVAEDHRRGRVYLPKADLDRFGVTEDDLATRFAGQPLRDLIGFAAERARAWLEAGAPLVPTLRGWGRLAVSGYLAGGRAALAALAEAGYDPTAGPAKPRRRQVLAHWLAATVRSAG
jgi:squalene synthase HpnC